MAIAAPNPRLAPATRAAIPFNPKSIFFLSFSLFLGFNGPAIYLAPGSLSRRFPSRQRKEE
jgi:hypothetical protein